MSLNHEILLFGILMHLGKITKQLVTVTNIMSLTLTARGPISSGDIRRL